MSEKLAVVAFGGNALLRGDEIGTIEQQEKNTFDTCSNLLSLIENDYNLIITHGNGPQVGNILLRNEAGYEKYKIPRMPLDICVADSQGGIGYMIERQMFNVLHQKNIDKNIVTIVTEVVVDKEDDAFKNPTKPVGAFYLKEEADLLAKANDWIFREDPRKRGWRRVVPSPKPLDVLNKEVISQLAREGKIVIAVGGGGVPVFFDGKGNLQRVEAVIDKDLASSLLATQIKADEFYILTDVPKVYINFSKPNQTSLDEITISEAEKYLEEGQFAAGSMKPKVEAAINFIRNGGKKAIITEAKELGKENAGTRIIPG